MSEAPAGRIEQGGLVFSRHLLGMSGGRRTGATLTQSAYLLLACLDAGGPMSIAELAGAIGLETSTMNRQTAALVREGWAERIPDPAGGLARKFRPTAAGRQAFEEERAARVAGIERIAGDWSAGDLDAFATLLDRFNLAVERRRKSHWPRA
ncbi:MarR family winged helix-turn-helix transcriptional regulator [Xylanimonas protaetiae]|uniref:MarR family transcriptional regulator n=1 Tax=Xylanimonas protaetiae TaxID=2509457 RepID=A0A4P6F9I3_9MICO|nr:MarR family transcriptional regulator [Xylanimonas protaetiae]QAY71583.1 MarR family transcriptional regulator [Xylanimonas protaetiae]